MAATPSVKLVKQTSYKGGVKTWSNRYHFNGGTPATDADWHSLMDAMVAQEKNCYTSETTITEGVGYAAGSDVPISSKAYAVAGLLVPAGGSRILPLEECALWRFSTTARTSKNHPIYLFKYVHNVPTGSGADNELLEAATKAVHESVATAFITGFTISGNTYVLAGPNGATAIDRIVNAHVTHRDFPR